MTPDPIIKICGITRAADALHAVEEGATALGFVFWPRSPRVISRGRARDIIAALPAHVTMVGVFVNESAEGIRRVVEATGIHAVQLHGDETPQDADGIDLPILKSVSLDDAAAQSSVWPDDTTLLLDVADPVRRGGTGVVIDWARAADVARHHRVVLAGGLTPLNVEQAIRTVSPFGVDVSSGVEESPGVKDAEKVSSFLSNARRAFSAQQKRTL
jgi:phosphoribosylanthranilate isomerase